MAMNEKNISLRFNWNPVFREVNKSKKRYRILKGSAGSGKSVDLAQDYIKKLSDMRYKGCNLLCVRKVEGSNRNSTFAELQKAIYENFGEYAPKAWEIKQSPMMIRSKITGNSAIFRGMKDYGQREKIKSITFENGKVTWIWCEEATDLLFEDVDILDDRLRGILPDAHYYQLTLSFNPVSATHWIKKRYFDCGPRDDVLLSHSTYRDNRFIDPDYYNRMERRKTEDPEGYKVYGLGDWGELGGLILPRYEVADMKVALDYFDYMALGQDFGFNHANAILLIGSKDGNIYVCKEIYVHEKDTEEVIEITERELSDFKHLTMWCDSSEPARIKTWRKAGWSARRVKKEPGSVNAQIDWIKQHGLYINGECVNTIKEVQQWRWQKDDKMNVYMDKPIEFQDDAMAALRYGVEGWRRGSSISFD